jgi:acyl-CoA synthetase (AMP-forming)/AMP-acid ligase II
MGPRATARRVPDTVALIFGERAYTYRELDAQVDRAAAALARLGLARGDRFALMATNSDAFVVAFYAALRLGAIFVPVNPASAPPELRYLLEDSGATVFVHDPAVAATVDAARAAGLPPTTRYVLSPPELADLDFATKLDLIVAVIAQGADQLLDGTARALADTHDDRAALRALLGAYVSFSLTHFDLMDALTTEVPHLPEPHRGGFRETQRRYLDQWREVLARLHPDLPALHTRVCLQAALTLINDVARTPHLRRQPSAATALTAVGHAILGPRPRPAGGATAPL